MLNGPVVFVSKELEKPQHFVRPATSGFIKYTWESKEH